MKSHIYLRKDGQSHRICTVDLEVVPGGTYVIDGVPYTLVEKPTFIITGDTLRYVELTVEPIAQR